MTRIAKETLASLPNLRRYAIALTGHRRWGDRYFEIMLEALLETPSRIRPCDDVRFRLYELLHEAMKAVTIGTSEPEDEPGDLLLEESGARQGLLSLSLLERKIVLLVLMEGFDLMQAAALVGLPAAKAKASLDGALAKLCPRVPLGPRIRHLPARGPETERYAGSVH